MRNQDGGGYSFIEDEKLVVKKGYFDAASMLDEYRKDHDAQSSSPFLLHFRISTSGIIDEVNTHPHHVRDDLVMAHNGHLTGYGDKEQSDTLEFVALVLKHMPPVWEEDHIQTHLIERYINGDKMAFLRADGEYYIINEEAGVWKDGMWFSNKSYEKTKVYKTRGFTGQVYHGTPKNHNPNTLIPADYTACGWDEDDLVTGAWSTEVDDANIGEFETYFDEICAYCDEKLDADDAEFCIQLDAWYPVCMECIIGNEDELVQLGVVCDAVTEVWDELMNEIEERELVAAEEEDDKDTPATSKLWALTANVFSS
jgi:hypothetical protein